MEYDSASLSGSQRQDSGLTFAAQWEVFANRGEASQFGAVRFSEKLGGFLLSGTDGKELVTPESGILAALGNLRLTDNQGQSLRSRLGTFNRPAQTHHRDTGIQRLTEQKPGLPRMSG